MFSIEPLFMIKGQRLPCRHEIQPLQRSAMAVESEGYGVCALAVNYGMANRERILHYSITGSIPRPCFNKKTVYPGMVIPMLKIRWSPDHLIFNMGIPTLVRRHICIETAPCLQWLYKAHICNVYVYNLTANIVLDIVSIVTHDIPSN